VSLAGVLALGIVTHDMGPPPLENAEALSTVVLDRNGELLRAYTTPDGRWRLPVSHADVDPLYLKILFAFEDRRFHTHRGIDLRGILRVGTEVARRGRLISGGSTLTMQTARLLDDAHDKTASVKLRQMIRALQLERRLTKDQILDLYLRLAPMGGNIEGVRAASFLYLGKEPRRLSIAEAALLVALPQSPNARRPDRHAIAAKRARDRIIRRAIQLGVVPHAEGEAAMREPVPTERRNMPQFAAHLSDGERERNPTRPIHRTTLDLRIQAALEALARDHVKGLAPGLSAAIVAVDHTTGAVVASVGSPGHLDDARQGAVDMTRAIRSPGSTLKPLIYGLAFDAGIAHPETLIEDRPTRFGAYVPKNFDHEFLGTVTLREALAKSLNIPAVKLLDALGPARLTAALTRIDIAPQLPKDAEPSLAIALGGVGLKLTDLAALYAAIARGGEALPVSHLADANRSKRARLMSETAAWYLAEVLKNAPPPAGAKAGQIAYKTGTSYGYRDAWSAGFDGRHTIAVWVGRPDGQAVPGLNGRQAAAPLLFDAFARIGGRRTPLAPAPRGVLKATGADLPAPLRRFHDPREEIAAPASAFREKPLSIAFPPDRAELEAVASDGEGLTLKAEGGTLPLTFLVDGAPVASDPARREVTLDGLGRGFVRLGVIDALGRSDRVTVRLK
jgi:penicillin-binding protein 1C